MGHAPYVSCGRPAEIISYFLFYGRALAKMAANVCQRKGGDEEKGSSARICKNLRASLKMCTRELNENTAFRCGLINIVEKCRRLCPPCAPQTARFWRFLDSQMRGNILRGTCPGRGSNFGGVVGAFQWKMHASIREMESQKKFTG